MKLAKRFLALAIVAVMLVSTCLVVGASETATVTMSQTSTKTLDYSVKYSTYDMTGSVCGGSSNAYVLEFDPADGAIPMAYTTAGGANLYYFNSHIRDAKAEGYEVLGAINGSFFNGNYSSMCGILISGGRIIVADDGSKGEEMGLFTSTGEFTHVYANLNFSVTADGKTLSNGLAAVNKDYAYVVTGKNIDANRFFYYDDYAKTKVAENIEGYEILCEKLDYTELAVGETLKAKVISVTETTYGASRPENDSRFYLFMPKASSTVSYASGLAAGDSIEITVKDLNPTAEAMNNAYSAISSCYALVKDGVDKTNTMANIGTHSVTLERAWTAFGVKADGSYVYFINEEKNNGLTLKDVAAAMMKLGCEHVYRLDGGGSSAMYNSEDGVVYLAENAASGGRAVCDVLLIVSKKSTSDSAITAELQAALDEAKAVANPDAELSANIAEAEALLSQTYPAKGDVKQLISKLNPENLVKDNLAAGKSYVFSTSDGGTTSTPAGSWNANLTDEVAFDACDDTVWNNGGNATWLGLKSDNISPDNYAYITLDLGDVYDISGIRIHVATNTAWGVATPEELYAQYSVDGTEYISTRIGVSSDEAYWTGADVDAQARYVRFKVYIGGSWSFFNEIKVYAAGANIEEPTIPYEGSSDTPADKGLRGDVDADGEITASDYLYLKRIYFGTLKMSALKDPDNAKYRCDVEVNDLIEAMDYILLKRAYFGTYKIVQD